jgi:tRNA(Arg) A34 adenosine deaminase TadA
MSELMQHITHLRTAIGVAQRARDHGNHPFGALLVDENNVVLLEAENTVNTERDCTGHAETNLMRLASQRFDRATLAGCTLYTSTEPCAMCAGAIHWGGVGRVVYALSEAGLYTLSSDGSHPDNETMRLPCRELFAHCGRPVAVIGPLIEDEATLVHAGFWE